MPETLSNWPDHMITGLVWREGKLSFEWGDTFLIGSTTLWMIGRRS